MGSSSVGEITAHSRYVPGEDISADETQSPSSQVQIGSTLDRDDLTHGRIATRQQTTEVRTDDVSTAQVHHYDPEPRVRILLSDVIFWQSRKKRLCATNFPVPRGVLDKVQKGWPLPSRNSNQILDQLNQVNHGDQNVSHLSRSIASPIQASMGGSPECRSQAHGTLKR